MLKKKRDLNSNEIIEILENNGIEIDINAINYNCENLKLKISDTEGNEFDFDSYSFMDETYLPKEEKELMWKDTKVG